MGAPAASAAPAPAAAPNGTRPPPRAAVSDGRSPSCPPRTIGRQRENANPHRGAGRSAPSSPPAPLIRRRLAPSAHRASARAQGVAQARAAAACVGQAAGLRRLFRDAKACRGARGERKKRRCEIAGRARDLANCTWTAPPRPSQGQSLTTPRTACSRSPPGRGRPRALQGGLGDARPAPNPGQIGPWRGLGCVSTYAGNARASSRGDPARAALPRKAPH